MNTSAKQIEGGLGHIDENETGFSFGEEDFLLHLLSGDASFVPVRLARYVGSFLDRGLITYDGHRFELTKTGRSAATKIASLYR
jgi:hypothetical protein